MIDAMPLVRTYLEGLSSIQMQIRRDIDETIKLSETMVEDAIKIYAARYGDEATSGIVATEYDDGWIKGVQIHLLRTNIEYRDMLSKKNSNLERLSRRFVSSARLTQR
jgi:hypothetical protein